MATPTPKSSQQFRLAFRVEGAFWNAYLAQTHTMEPSILLGSIRLDVVDNNLNHTWEFMDLMKKAMEVMLETVGLEAKWYPPQPAPEHERA